MASTLFQLDHTQSLPIRRTREPAPAWSTNPFALSPAAGSPFDTSALCPLAVSWSRDDAMPSSPLQTMSTSPPAPKHYVYDMPRVEENFFKDFMCCGHYLPDLHGVMTHYEQVHTVARGPDVLPAPAPVQPSLPVPAQAPSATSAPASASLPQGLTPSQPPNQLQLQPHPAPQSPFVTSYISQPPPPVAKNNDDGMELEMEFDDSAPPAVQERETVSVPVPMTPPVTTSPSYPRSLHAQQQYSLPPSIFFNPMMHHHHPSPESSPSPPPISSQYDYPTQKPLGGRTSSSKRRAGDKRVVIGATGMAISKKDVGGTRPRFRCPTVGCTKAYLNPNGLKYHITKGTCDMKA